MEKAQQIGVQFQAYITLIPLVAAQESPLQERQAAYFSEIQPLFQKIKTLAQDILLMNQANMVEANDAARTKADAARRVMLAAIIAAALLAILFSYLAHRWILHPISRLIESANENPGAEIWTLSWNRDQETKSAGFRSPLMRWRPP